MLERALAGINGYRDENVLLGYETADDAGVYRLDEDRALVQTVDFFTPVVDDPFIYGQIAAANSLSDIYAMGGTPRLALAVVGFPEDKLEEEVLHEIMRGGTEKMNEAKVSILGGHSVKDPEVKFGYCVTGWVNPASMYTNGAARPGDALLLTKPLGTGIATTAIKYEKASPQVVNQAIEWMLKLNSGAVDRMKEFDVRSVTDITGYGLLGHAGEMARASGATVRLKVEQLPILDGVEELARQGMLPAAIETNRDHVGAAVSWEGVPIFRQQVLLDPQTSGGLLISLPEENADGLARQLESEGFLGQRVGDVMKLGPTPLCLE